MIEHIFWNGTERRMRAFCFPSPSSACSMTAAGKELSLITKE